MGRGDTEAGGIPQVKPRRGLAWGLVSSFPSPETQALNPAVPCVSRVSESLALSRVVGHTLLSSPLSGGLCHCPWVTGECGAQEGGFRMCWVWIPNSGRLERKVPCLFFPRLGFSCSAPTCHEPQMGFWWGGVFSTINAITRGHMLWLTMAVVSARRCPAILGQRVGGWEPQHSLKDRGTSSSRGQSPWLHP